MHFTVQDVSAYLLTVRPDAGRRIESFFTRASPCTRKSAFFAAGSAAPPSDQVRKPNDLIRSFSMFSATGDGCGAASGASASRTATWTATFGLPLARMKSDRKSVV